MNEQKIMSSNNCKVKNLKKYPMQTDKGNYSKKQFIHMWKEFNDLYNCIQEYVSDKKVIVRVKGGIVHLDKFYWNKSPTIVKYRNYFLSTTSKEIERLIRRNIYILTDLN